MKITRGVYQNDLLVGFGVYQNADLCNFVGTHGPCVRCVVRCIFY